MNDEQIQNEESEDHLENVLINSSIGAGATSDDQEVVRPPDSKKFQMEMDQFTERIRVLETRIKSIEEEIHVSSNSKASIINRGALQTELQVLRTQREKVIEERKQHDGELKGLNMHLQKKNDACTKLQAGVRYKTETRIDEAVRKLEHQMQAQQLNLREEKRLVAEIDILKRSKRNLNEYLSLKQLVDQLRNRQKIIRGERDACVKRINRLKSREEEIRNLLDSDASDVSEEMEKKRVEQLNEVEELKKELEELRIQKRDVKNNFVMDQKRYYSAVKEIRSQKQKEEHDTRKNQKLAALKDVHKSRSRGKQQPHEKEKALCDTLLAHLEKLHKSQLPDLQVSSLSDKEPVASLLASADDEGTFLKRKSATDDLVGVFAGISRTPRRATRKGRRSSAKEVPRKLNLHPDVVKNLLALSLSPPSTYADIPKVLEVLQEKKDFFERATTSNTVMVLTSNDPMAPIAEETSPEFPSLWKEKNQNKNPEEINQTENILFAKGCTNDQQGNSIGSQSSSKFIKDEQSMLDKSFDKSNNDNLNEISRESELEEEAFIHFSQLQNEGAANKNCVTDAQADTTTEGHCETIAAELVYNDTVNAADTQAPDVCANLSAANRDVQILDEPDVTNSVENSKVSAGQEETITCSNNQLQSNCKTGIGAKEENFIQDFQIHCSHCTSSSSHGSSLLLDENDLEAAYDRNSLNNGANLVKVQYEKCPA